MVAQYTKEELAEISPHRHIGKKTKRFEFEKPGDLIHCDYEVFAVPPRVMATAI